MWRTVAALLIAGWIAGVVTGVALSVSGGWLPEIAAYATLLQVAVSTGTLLVAAVSLYWAVRTFSQRERHENAKEIPHYALQIVYVPYDPNQFIPQYDDPRRLQRWQATFQGRGWHERINVLPQRYTVNLLCFGPGTITSAEVPYTVDIFEERPTISESPVESFSGVFRFYHAPPGSVRAATTNVTMTYFPFWRLTMGKTRIRNISGLLSEMPPDEHMSQQSFDFDNQQMWQFLQALPKPVE